MLRAALTLLSLFSIWPLMAQDLRGKWIGTLFQDTESEFRCELTLKKQSEDRYTGTAYYETTEGSHVGHVLFRISLTYQGDSWQYLDEEILRDEKESEGFFWCMKQGELRLSKESGGLYLQGPWSAEGCDPGRFRLKKIVPVAKTKPEVPKEKPAAPVVTLEDRKVEDKATVLVEAKNIEISIWDNNKEDGDIISLNLNGKWILRNYRVSKARHTIRVAIEEENVLVLHAENLGKYPPNTAAISVNDGKEVQKIILKSDTGTSESIRISKK